MFSKRTPPPHSSNPLSRALEARRTTGAPLIDLTESNPTRCGFSYDTAAFARALSTGAAAPYEPDPRGMRAAREAVAASYAERGFTVDPECLVLTSGTSEGYAHLFTLLADAGDEILVPTPGYPLLEVLTGLGGVQLVQYRQVYAEGAGWRIDLEALEAGISSRSRAVVVVSPNNPTGAFLKQEELAAIASLCRDHDMALIADEVFTDFGTGEDPTRVASAVAHDGALTFVLNGLSKMSGLPQMKLAWIHASGPSDLRDAAVERLAFIADAYLSVGTPVQHAAPVLLAAHRAVAPQIKRRVESNLKALEGLAAGSGGSCRVLPREGGWYAVVGLPDHLSDEEAALVLLERDGVLAHPGYFYDFPPAGAFLVLSLLPETAVFREGARKLVERIKGWDRDPRG